MCVMYCFLVSFMISNMIFIEVSSYWDYDIISKLHSKWRGLELLTLTSPKASLFKWQMKYEIPMYIKIVFYYYLTNYFKVLIYNIRIRINLNFYMNYLKITIFSERLRFTVTFRVSLFSCQSERYLTYWKNLWLTSKVLLGS